MSGGEGEIVDEAPRLIFGGVRGAAFVVFGHAEFQIRGEADVGFFGMHLAADHIHVVHRG